MNLPNKLTISRIVLTFVFMFFLFSNGILAKSLALFVFILASSTDFLDGYIARKQKQVTNFGKLMDPIADKVLVLAAFLAFVELGIIPAWMVVLIIVRELLITGLRLFATGRGKLIAAGRGGKHKTVSQVAAIFSILGFILFKEIARTGLGVWGPGWEILYKRVIFYLMFITVVLTLISGILYLWENRRILLDGKNN